MKRFLSLIMCLSCFVIIQKNPVSAMQEPDFYYKRACWISYLDIEQYLKDLDEDSFRAEVSRMYNLMLANGVNTAIVHVRAFGDAIYPSQIYPLSIHISSGRSCMQYDAFAIMVELAHTKGLQIEAWINPYRLSKDSETTQCYKQTSFYYAYQDVIIEYRNLSGDTVLSLDPASERAQELIVEGIEEIISKYDVDGIHFDDYFYMDKMADALPIQEKMNNVNNLLLKVHQCTKQHNVIFGISPAGNIDYAISLGADVERWLSEPGYIDYIMPQLYWSNAYQQNDEMITLYDERCKQWMDINILDLPIYTGLALYRAGEVDKCDIGWSMCNSNLKEQWEYAALLGYDGYCLFRYAWLEQDISLEELKNLDYCFDELYSAKSEKEPDYSTLESFTGQQDDIEENQILVHVYKKDGSIDIYKRPCNSFVIDMPDVKDITITYLNARNENCIAVYRTKCDNGTWNRWVSDGNFTNFEQFCTIVEVEIMRIPHKTVKNTCFFVDWCYNNN